MVTPVDPRIKGEQNLSSVPNEVKAQILSCLGIKDQAKASLVNVLWKSFMDKPLFWQQVAKKMGVQVQNQANIKNEVIGFCRYHSINEVFKQSLPGAIKDELQKCKFETEKYQSIVKFLQSNPRPSPFWDFLIQLGPNPSAIQLQTAKQLIQDDAIPMDPFVYQECLHRVLGKTALNEAADFEKANLEIFTVLIDKAKKAGYEMLLDSLLPHIVYEYRQVGRQEGFLEVLLQAGAKPNSLALADAARVSDDFQTLKLLLDYADQDVRSAAIEELNENEMRIEPDDLPLPGNTPVPIAKSFDDMRKVIKDAPPPTYGGSQKKQ